MALEVLKKNGHEIIEITIPNINDILQLYTQLLFSDNMAMYTD